MPENTEPAEPADYPLLAPSSEEIVVGVDGAKEDLALRTGRDLKAQQTNRELQKILREGNVESHLHRVIVVALYVVALSAAAMFLVLIWHFITPYPFLKEEQLSGIKQLLFSGSLGAGISGLAKKYLGVDAKS